VLVSRPGLARAEFIEDITPSQELPAHSAVMSRLGINLKAARERTGHHPHIPWPRIEKSLTINDDDDVRCPPLDLVA